MADHRDSFRVWTGIVVDMDGLSDAAVGRWLRLGCRIAMVGEGGTATFDGWEHLAAFLRVSGPAEAAAALAELPGVSVRIEDRELNHDRSTGSEENGRSPEKKHALNTDRSTVNAENRVDLHHRHGFAQVLHRQKHALNHDRSTVSQKNGQMIHVSYINWSRYQQDAAFYRGSKHDPSIYISSIPLISDLTKVKDKSSRRSEGKLFDPGTPSSRSCGECSGLVDYMNEAGRTTFPTRGKYLEMLHARHQEFDVEACKKVCRVKAWDWMFSPQARERHLTRQGEDMAQYYRPGTLFRPTKFPGYLGLEDPGEFWKGGR